MIAFYILAPIMVLAALGHPVRAQGRARRAAAGGRDDLSLAVLYAALEAPFLFAVQIIVYTGAILMLFLFVLMLVGVDASDSVVETIRGQRLFADPRRADPRRRPSWSASSQITSAPWSGSSDANEGGNIEALANILFSSYVFAFEVTSALLITAAMGAMVLAHRERLTPKPTQADLAAAAGPRLRRDRAAPRPAAPSRRLRPAQRGRHPGAAARRHARPRPRSPGCWPPAAPCAPAPRDVEAVQRSIDFAPDGAPATRTPRRPDTTAEPGPARPEAE